MSSKHKIDAVDPTVKLSALNNDKVGDWHKTVTFSSTPSETLNTTSSDGKATDGSYSMELRDSKGNTVKICGIIKARVMCQPSRRSLQQNQAQET